MKTLLALTLAWLAAAGSCRERSAAPPAAGTRVAVQGTLTREGVECPALRDANGTLWTLAGPLDGHRAGDRVCVRGRVAEISTCMQGITISVESIGPPDDCR